jgi:hypothetical protein
LEAETGFLGRRWVFVLRQRAQSNAEKTESGEKDGTLKVADRRICAKASAALPHSKGARLRRSAATRKRKSRGIKPLLLRLASQFQKYERREKKLIPASG